MKVKVDLYAASGKWKYGGVVEVDESHPLWTDAHKLDLLKSQDFVMPDAFGHYIVVVSHRDDYDEDPSHYFCQHLYPVGAFSHLLTHDEKSG